MLKKLLLTITAGLSLAAISFAGLGSTTLASVLNHNDCEVPALLTSHHMSISGSTLTESFTVSEGCPITLSLVSYEAANTLPFPQNLPQTLYDSKTDTVGVGHYTWQISLPPCYYQADFVHGNVITNLSVNHRYGIAVIDTTTGGRTACQTGTITVSKTTVPAGDPTTFSLTISSQNGHVFGDATQSITDGGKVVYTVSPGTYNVVETAVDGWTQTSNTCQNLVVEEHHVEYLSRVNNDDEDQSPANINCQIVNTKNTTPPTGGKGGGQVLSATTTTPQIVQTPVGAVNGGEGAASKTTDFAALLGLAGSLSAFGYGIRRFNKSQN